MSQSSTTTLTLNGVHHLKFPVSDLTATISWFETALCATRVHEQDHLEHDGTLYAAIMMLPGVAIPVELRLAPAAASAVAGYDPVTFGVTDRDALQEWITHLDAAGIAHSPMITGYIGELVALQTPDGLAIRIYTNPPEGFSNVQMNRHMADMDNPWLNATLMARPTAPPAEP